MNKRTKVCMNCLYRNAPPDCSVEWIQHKGYKVGPNKNHTCPSFEYTKEALWEVLKE